MRRLAHLAIFLSRLAAFWPVAGSDWNGSSRSLPSRSIASLWPSRGRFNLGAALLELERPLQAIGWTEQALRLRTRLHGADSFEAAPCYNNLGCCLKDLGRFAEADRANQEALRLHTKHSGPRSERVAGVLNNIAETHLRAGRAGDALPVIEQALDLSLSSDITRCVMFDTLAGIYLALGKLPESRLAGDRSIEAAACSGRTGEAIEYARKQAERLDRGGRGEEAQPYHLLAQQAGRLVYFGSAERSD